MSKQCQSCGAQNDDQALFCNQCSTPFKSTTSCPNCHAENSSEALFCNRCGTSLSATRSPRGVRQEVGWGAPAAAALSPSSSPPSDLSGAGWEPAPMVEPAASNIQPSQDRMSRRQQAAARKAQAKAAKTLTRGEVRGFKERMERKNPNASISGDDTIWTFRLERYHDGQRLPPIPVEMRGQVFSGFINEGDILELRDKWRGEGLHRTKRVYNVTNAVLVKAQKSKGSIAIKLWVFVVILAVAAFIYLIGTSWSF